MRINQWIAHNTTYSRREADTLIKEGKVKINHKIASLNDKITRERVFINGSEIKPRNPHEYTIIAYHKPKGEIVSKVDDRGRKVIFDSLDSKFAHFIPIGRLDYASSGLLLLTDNPAIATIFMKSTLSRIYNIRVNGVIPQELINAAKDGITLKDARTGGHKHSKITSMTFAPFISFDIIKESTHYTNVKVGIAEGQNRELRRFFGHFGLEVLNLKRVSYGFLHLNALREGKSRYISKRDYAKVRAWLGEQKNTQQRNNNAGRNKRK